MKNLRQTGSGWQKYCRVAGRFCQEHTPERPSVLDVRNWVRAQHMSDAPPKPTTRGNVFQRDVATYLDSVTDMPTYSDREFHMLWWAAIFKGRKRNTITPLEIKTALAKLRETHSPSSCNKRRTALMSFYTAMNGRSGYNPVRDVPKYQEDEEPRDQRMWTAYRILALMRPSQTRARLRVILWTGWPHAQLKRLKPAHLDLAHARAFVTPRRKGKGRKGVWLPLLPGAVIALRDFVKWDCFTPFDEKRQCLVPFSNSAMHSSFARAVAKFNAHRARFGHPPIDAHPYDLRHSFGTMFAERTEDERALQEAMMHSRAEQSRRYTQRATERRVATAFAQVANAKKTA